MKSEEKLMFPIWESKVVSPMLSGHFSGSVVVTADLEKKHELFVISNQKQRKVLVYKIDDIESKLIHC